MREHRDLQHVALVNQEVNTIMIIIDRFENNKAVLEIDCELIVIPRSEVPDEAKEGDILNLIVNIDKTSSRKQNIKNKIDKLFRE